MKSHFPKRCSTSSSTTSTRTTSTSATTVPSSTTDRENGSGSGSDTSTETLIKNSKPWLSRIFKGAALYDEVLDVNHDEFDLESHLGNLAVAGEGRGEGGLKPPSGGRGRSNTAASVTDLIGRDLGELKITDTGLGSTPGTPPSRPIDADRSLHPNSDDESEADVDGDDDADLVITEDDATVLSKFTMNLPIQHTLTPTSTLTSSYFTDTPPLTRSQTAGSKGSITPPLNPEEIFAPTPEEKLRIFSEEFGVLAREGEKEEILVESDGMFWHGVAILGVVHLTSHRVAFHASLMPTRTDCTAIRTEVIRAGPATAHRPNPHRKRKIWFELTGDMISTFNSSSDEDLVQPIKSVLLSKILHIRMSPMFGPRFLEFQVLVNDAVYHAFLSFDTEESASEWYNALQAAIFLSRRNMRSLTLTEEEAAAQNGVRFSIPLERIESSSVQSLPLANMFRLELTSGGNELEGIAFVMQGNKKEAFVEKFGKYTKLRKDAALLEAENTKKGVGVGLGVGLAPIIVDFGTLAATEDETSDKDDFMFSGKKDKFESVSDEGTLKAQFGIPQSEPIWMTRARLRVGGLNGLLTLGFFAVSPLFICFWAKARLFKTVKYRFPLTRFKSASPIRAFMGYGLRLVIEGHESLDFGFSSLAVRDEVIMGLQNPPVSQVMPSSPGVSTSPLRSATDPAPGSTHHQTPHPHPIQKATHIVRAATTSSPPFLGANSIPMMPGANHTPGNASSHSPPLTRSTSVISPLSRAFNFAQSKELPPALLPHLPRVLNLPRTYERHISTRHFVCLTIGSRGDIQPYIALGKGLQAAGHKVTIVTHPEYQKWIEGWGITHRSAGGDPGALMKLSVEHKMFSPAFFKESLGNFRTWLDDLLRDAWVQCQDADVLIESPSAMAGVHIAEALDIPYFRAFTMPWSKTSEYPHAFISPPVDSPKFNSATYVLFDNVFWVATSGQINKWRREVLMLENTDMGHLAQGKIPFIYNFSTAVVPWPLDWKDQISITGYWFLDNPDLNWSPSSELIAFMAKARLDNKPLVYIGFGSITVPHPTQMSKSIIAGVLKSDVRAIISKGWSTRVANDEESGAEVIYPPECFLVDSVPHDWLFPQLDAAMHHGGAGTTGASLRAGIPTLIKPWFGDQFFWATRVQKLGAGLRVPSLRPSAIAEALTHATSDRIIKEKAASVGERIRAENGVANAIHAIYTYLARAKRSRKNVRELSKTSSLTPTISSTPALEDNTSPLHLARGVK